MDNLQHFLLQLVTIIAAVLTWWKARQATKVAEKLKEELPTQLVEELKTHIPVAVVKILKTGEQPSPPPVSPAKSNEHNPL